jgi:magnesium transporter
MAIFQTKHSAVRKRNAQKAAYKKVIHKDLTWYNFEGMGEADYRYLQKNFPFHPLDFEDLRSTKQRPKLDEYDSYLFVIFHVPYFDRRTKRLHQEEVDVFIGHGYLITIHSGRLKVLGSLFEECRATSAKEAYMAAGSGFLMYELMSRLFEHAFPMLDRIAERINDVERDIFEGRSKEMVEELSHLKLEIINFRRIIRPQRVLIAAIEDKKKRFLPENLEIYFDDVEDTIARTSDLLDNYKEVVESLEDTNETFIQHRTNNVVKVLTYVSLLTLPMASLSGLMAMNIRYPFAVDQTIFFIIICSSFVMAIGIFAYMFWKRWI